MTRGKTSFRPVKSKKFPSRSSRFLYSGSSYCSDSLCSLRRYGPDARTGADVVRSKLLHQDRIKAETVRLQLSTTDDVSQRQLLTPTEETSNILGLL